MVRDKQGNSVTMVENGDRVMEYGTRRIIKERVVELAMQDLTMRLLSVMDNVQLRGERMILNELIERAMLDTGGFDAISEITRQCSNRDTKSAFECILQATEDNKQIMDAANRLATILDTELHKVAVETSESDRNRAGWQIPDSMKK